MLILMLASALQPSAATAEDPSQAIVVTGTRIGDDRDRLAACLARRCPPLEDMEAAARLAENLFVAGEYREARAVLGRAIDRNRNQTARYPREVAGLYRGHARVSVHLGEGETYQRSTYQMARSLADGLAADSTEVLLGRLEVGDMQASLGHAELAQRTYSSVEEAAGRAGNPRVAALAQLRAAWLRHLTGDTRGAERRLLALSRSDAATTPLRLAAEVILARISRSQGDRSATDRLIAEILRNSPQSDLTLLWSPAVPAPRAGSRFSDHWIDVGFWVRPDGRVEDAEILRNDGPTDWAEPVVRAVGSRIYLPLRAEPSSPGLYRIERYTYTSLFHLPDGSRIRTGTGTPRIERVDLPPDEPRPSDGGE
jgi:tetratricopeptide (TPR) repeat protein